MIAPKDLDGHDDEVWFLNRNLVTVRPRQPFVDWVRKQDPDDLMPEDEIRNSPGAYLIPDFEVPGECERWVRQHFPTLFEMQLNEWYMNPSMWPRDRSWERFNEWFEWEVIEIVWDLVDGPLSSEPPDLDDAY
ncbi:MAG: hypothetical protein WEA24_03260 [Gemmatimonadota bacterium]